MRVAVDTNVMVSAAIWRTSAISLTLDKILRGHTLLISEQCLAELAEVLPRSRFNKYASTGDRLVFVALMAEAASMVLVNLEVRDCRDPKDNKFLELALAGNADLIVSGDEDLLVLHPWRGIPIPTPKQALDLL